MSELATVAQPGTPTTKIREEHLRRRAIVYVRQSTLTQVEVNLESQRRQYALADRAGSLGWPKGLVDVIDDDLGRSGAQSDGRVGFARLVATVSLGEVGIVIGLEVSRLARNNKDWYHLLDLCAIFGTLIADEDGIYDPRLFNDRLLLGLKGTMSEAELHIMRNRLNAGLENKARRGALVLGLPVGFQLSDDGRIERHPDEAVRHALKDVFETFASCGSVFGVLQELRHQGALLPRRKDAFGWEGVEWIKPTYRGVLRILKNPAYAGAYVFGRTGTRRSVTEDGRVRKRAGLPVDQNKWPVLILNHHEGYVGWDEFVEIQKRIRSNRRGFGLPGPVGRGASILSGLVHCAVCGRSMALSYTGTRNKCPRFNCWGELLVAGGQRCQAFGARRLEDHVEELILSVLEPSALEAALIAMDDFAKHRAQQIKRLELEVERATIVEGRARRQFERVEPENRLVARELERKWEAALAALGDAKRVRERKMAALPPPLSEEEKKEVRRALGRLTRLWSAPTTTPQDRKEIARLLIDHVEVRVDRTHARLHFRVYWVTGQVSTGSTKMPRTGEHRYSTPDTDLEIVKNLAPDHTDAEIAAELGRLGRKTPHGMNWTATRVRSVRVTNGIEKPVERPPGFVGWKEIQRRLRINHATFRALVRQGKLHATQAYPHARWRVPEEEVERLERKKRKQP